MPTVNRNLLKTGVLNYLRAEIISGRMLPGTHLVESKLAEMLEVSRGPIRDALLVLEQEGLVATPRNGRTRVLGLTAEDAIDLFKFRMELEALAIEQAIERNASDITPLLTVVEQFNAMDRARPEAAELDLSFHANLIQLSRNRPLIQSWMTYGPTILGLLTITDSATADYERISIEHRTVAELIQRKDVLGAQQILRQHLNTGRDLLIARLEAVRPDYD